MDEFSRKYRKQVRAEAAAKAVAAARNALDADSHGATDGAGDTTPAPRRYTPERLLKRYTDKTKAQIMRCGDVVELAALRLADYDAGRIIGGSPILTPKEVERLVKRVEGMDTADQEEYYDRLMVFTNLARYETEVITVYRSTQAEVGALLMLVNKWNTLESDAARMSRAWKHLLSEGRYSDPEDNGISAFMNALDTVEVMGHQTGHTFTCDNNAHEVWVDIGGAGGLHGQIMEQAARVREKYGILKACINAVAPYIYRHSEFIFIPALLEDVIFEVWGEVYVRGLIDSTRFLRSELTRRRADGDATITEDDEYHAVFPDYDEVPESAAARRAYGKIAESMNITQTEFKI